MTESFLPRFFCNCISRCNYFLLLVSFIFSPLQPVKAQIPELRYALYNTLIGSFSGSIGSMINKKKDEKWSRTILKGFCVGSVGGAIMYGGKKMNYMIGKKNELGYAWISRIIYCAGNSIVENAAANRRFNAQWHFDLGFVRVEYQTSSGEFSPKIMPSAMIGTFYLIRNSKLDLGKTLSSGTLIFRSKVIQHDPTILAFTPTNGLVYRSVNPGPSLNSTFGHEIIHMFQFQDFSSWNNFTNPITDKWEARSTAYKKFKKLVFPDYSYELMIINYFGINHGGNGYHYCNNYLENEAQYLSTGLEACE